MSNAKLKVFNDRKYDIGVSTLNGQHINIKAGSFVLLSEDDISYIESQCRFDKKLFGGGKLRVGVEQEELLEEIGITKSEENYLPQKHEIKAKLSGSAASIKKWLADITDVTVLYEIYEATKEMDLPASKQRAVEDSLPDSLLLNED